MLTAILEVSLAFLAGLGLTALGLLIVSRWLLPLDRESDILAVVEARGDGAKLEQSVRSLLWLRHLGFWRGRLVIADEGLDQEGRRLARLLCANTGEVSLCKPEGLPQLIAKDT